MSESEYGRLAAQLTEVLVKLSAMEEKLTTYSDFKDKVDRHELAIQRIDQRCNGIQDAKLTRTVPWGTVKSGVIIGLIVGIVMLVINMFAMK